MSHEKQEKPTPLMEQYFAIKAQFPDALLFFQVGDFFELFFDDAQKAASYLAITLTKRGKNKGEDIPLCGIPVHALEHYLNKLIKGGFRVALCEQLGKPQPGTIVERGVTKVFTPATLTDASMLEEKSASYLLSFFPGDDSWGMVFGELLTAQLFATTIPRDATRMVEAELIRFFPDEIIIPNNQNTISAVGHFKKLGYYTTVVHNSAPDSMDWVDQQFATHRAQLDQAGAIKNSLATLHWYLQRHNAGALNQFKNIHFYQPDDYLILDSATQRNLEILQNTQDSSSKRSLFAVLDHAQTAMGSRTIKKWLQRPLVQKSAINQRLDVVEQLKNNVQLLQALEVLLRACADIERIVGRIALKRALTNDYLALKQSLVLLPELQTVLTNMQAPLAKLLLERIGNFDALLNLLDASLNDELPGAGSERLIKPGFDLELDHLHDLLDNGKNAFLSFEQTEVERTGIGSLKVSYNQITGYYIEITNTHTEKIPREYVHLQTLASRKRFTTPELKTLESDYFKAHTELQSIEAAVFESVKREVEQYLHHLRHLAQSIAYLDALFGFAKTAYEFHYTRPRFNDTRSLHITAGRHPVVEQHTNGYFEPNDISLNDQQSSIIVTGPNMGGKSTYLRQVALTSIMAQCGSFVPAEHADLAILDRVFTRIGSGDQLAEGKSTFFVEMEETATICTQATKNSLVILDEVGRGTSTYDGIALAQAILEHIHTTIQARCLFATHYHELTQLEQPDNGIVNFHAACKRVNNTIVFLHKIVRGISEGSFGLNVAKLAQLPQPIITRAGAILHELETGRTHATGHTITPTTQSPEAFLPATTDPLRERLQALDCAGLTARQALDLLWELSEKAKHT